MTIQPNFSKVRHVARAGYVALTLASFAALSGGAYAVSPDKAQREATTEAPFVSDVSAAEAAASLGADPSIIVLDVRTGPEFRAGHINGAINANYFGLDFRRKIAALDPGATYLVHCKSGHRSKGAIRVMQDEGISRILHLDSGFDGWKKAGLPVVKS